MLSTDYLDSYWKRYANSYSSISFNLRFIQLLDILRTSPSMLNVIDYVSSI